MDGNLEQLQEAMCRKLCGHVQLSMQDNGLVMLETPFTFPDGDQYPVYVCFSDDERVKLTDNGHLLMRLSYAHDIDAYLRGRRRIILNRIVREFDLDEENGRFSLSTTREQLATALLRFCQATTRIHDLSFLNRESVSSTFYDDLKDALQKMPHLKNFRQDYQLRGIPNPENYTVDFCFDGRNSKLIYLFGIPNKDKARLTTIALQHFLLSDHKFHSVVVFRNQTMISPKDVARLTDVAGTSVSSLESKNVLQRKLAELAA